jgi:hypothetical protein
MIHRRQFIERAAKAAFGLSILPQSARAYNLESTKGMAGFGSAKRIIFINVKGGMSHIDTFDPKQGKAKGPAKAIKTSADFQVTEYLPETAKVADRISLIRTMTAKIGVHGPAQYFMRTAFAERNTIKHPNLGAWAQHHLGASHDTLPSSACINEPPRYGNGFFAPTFSPIPILEPSAGLANIKVDGGMSRLKSKLELANTLSERFTAKYKDSNVGAYRDFYDETLRLLRSEDLKAFDLAQEDKATRELYGDSKFGQGCLLAKRLVKAGVRFVEVTSDGWDMHQDIKGDMDDIAPSFDQGYAALIRDLEGSGMLDSTLVVLATEFGRKPDYSGAGRGHYPLCFTVGLAGAGVKRGFVLGESDDRGATPDVPRTVGGFPAPIGHAAGIPRDKPFVTATGRPFFVGGTKAKPILEMFS